MCLGDSEYINDEDIWKAIVTLFSI